MDDGEIFIENEHASKSVDSDLLTRTLREVVRREGVHVESLTVVLSDHSTVHELNRTYLGHDYETDVLAFSYSEGDAVDGEVFVDLDTASERHAEFDATFEEEVFRYAIHGLLHLIGYSDETPEGKERMRQLEDRYLTEQPP